MVEKQSSNYFMTNISKALIFFIFLQSHICQALLTPLARLCYPVAGRFYDLILKDATRDLNGRLRVVAAHGWCTLKKALQSVLRSQEVQM